MSCTPNSRSSDLLVPSLLSFWSTAHTLPVLGSSKLVLQGVLPLCPFCLGPLDVARKQNFLLQSVGKRIRNHALSTTPFHRMAASPAERCGNRRWDAAACVCVCEEGGGTSRRCAGTRRGGRRGEQQDAQQQRHLRARTGSHTTASTSVRCVAPEKHARTPRARPLRPFHHICPAARSHHARSTTAPFCSLAWPGGRDGEGIELA